MGWGLWISLMVAIPAATVFSIGFYLHWSWRFTVKWLGTVSEIAFALMLLGLGLAGVALLVTHHPW